MTAFDIDPNGYLPLLRQLREWIRDRVHADRPANAGTACCA